MTPSLKVRVGIAKKLPVVALGIQLSFILPCRAHSELTYALAMPCEVLNPIEPTEPGSKRVN
jgi:hypothetical protein